MSRRTFPKCVAAGLLAAVVSPAAAQSPNPWRTGGREVAPAPRPVAPRSIPLTFERIVSRAGLGVTAKPFLGEGPGFQSSTIPRAGKNCAGVRPA